MKKIFLLILLFFLFKINVYATNDDLLNLKVNGIDVSCSGYSCEVEVDSKTAKLTYEKAENVKSTYPESGHSINFSNEHSIQVEVEYLDGVKVNYTVKIVEHVKSNDNTLSSLIINDEEVELRENIFVYSYETKFNAEMVKVIGKTTDEKAVCSEKEYKFNIESSSLSIEYPVTAENGDIRNYTIVLKRKNKPDTTLKTLTLSNIEFDFDPNVLDYEVSVPYKINTTEVKAIANSSGAEVKIKMEESFIVGENFINIIVTNKEEEAEDTYTIKINRLENVDESLANLKTLEIEGIDIDFDPNILEYELLYKEIPNKLVINALSKSEDGQVFIEDNQDLKDGSVVLVKVNLDNGIIRTYSLKIKLEVEEGNNKLLIIILICILLTIMIMLFVFQLKEGKGKKKKKVSRKKKDEEEIEII